MRAADVLKPLGVFVVVIAVVLAGTAALGYATGGSQPSPDGRNIDGQSPREWQAENIVVESDAENGTIEINSEAEDKRILVDTRHANQFARDDLEPVVDAVFRNGHEIRFAGSGDGDSFDSPSYNETLQEFDAVLVVAPTTQFTEEQVAGLEAFARAGGRVVVLNEPTQNVLSSAGLFGASAVTQQYTGDRFTGEFGMHVGDGVLYNIEDTKNDNNFKSIYATTATSGGLTRGVNRVTFDTAGRLVVPDDSEASTLLSSVDGTTQLETRRAGTYSLAARNGNVVLVADSSFIQESEVYDSDNEKFVSNLLRFLVLGNKPDDVPQAGGSEEDFDNGGEGTPEPPDESPGEPPQTATPSA